MAKVRFVSAFAISRSDLFLSRTAVKDVYQPRDFYTNTPRDFCYIQFLDVKDAEGMSKSWVFC